ncbi:aromatic ring-hydroxylating dioxygenase subunit alpha [Frankia sp. Cpl3]|nr:aromatic ring-hydroxylating dioxygenase subunit alpha [Frankia sp. Cpl3]
MAHFTKPAEGTWTEHYNLRTTLTSYEDSISPEYYELERKAVFGKHWLNVGRVEQIAKVGAYFTREIEVLNASIIVVRASGGEVKAFYNICRHRGNKLVWQDFPQEETSGTARQFTCKYHGWRYGLDGGCTFVQQEHEFFDFDRSTFGLVPVHCDVWEGWIFVNFDRESTPAPVKEYLGQLGAGIEGYPFHEMTQVHKYRAEIGANWKLYIDGFTEFYHAPVLHQKQAVTEESIKLQKVGYEALHYGVDGLHGVVSSWGGMAPPKDEKMVKPIERKLRSGLFGPWEPPIDIDLPKGLNPSGHPTWGLDSFLFYPNFMMLIWKPGWVLTYHYWPTSHNTHIFEGTCYFVPPKTAWERVQQELAVVSFKEYGLQDANTLEATQTMLESRIVTEFPLNDQEVMLRHLHETTARLVAEFEEAGRTGRPAPASSGA